MESINKKDKSIDEIIEFLDQVNSFEYCEVEWVKDSYENGDYSDDEEGVMNKSILDVGGEILSISQFTLYGDTTKGNRPSYMKALNGEEAIKLYETFNEEMNKYVVTKPGIFGAEMMVNISNDGPITLIMEF